MQRAYKQTLIIITRDRISDGSFRQRLDPISKNIIRRQNPLELVFEDVSTVDAENPIVGSLIRELDLKKKQTNSYFIKYLPGVPGEKFEIKKHLDKLRDIKNPSRRNNNGNNSNNGNNNGNLFPPRPRGEDLFPPRPPGSGGLPPPPPPPRPDEFEDLQRPNILRRPSPPPFSQNNAPNFNIPARANAPPNKLFGSETSTLTKYRDTIKERVT